MPTLDVAISEAKVQAKRSGKRQFVIRGAHWKNEYWAAHEGNLGRNPNIVGEVSATYVPGWRRLTSREAREVLHNL